MAWKAPAIPGRAFRAGSARATGPVWGRLASGMKAMLPRSCVLLATPLLPLLTAVGLVGLVGCEEAVIEEHAVPKGVEVVDEPAQSTPAPAPDASSVGARPWTVPADWKPVDEQRPMRLATYAAETELGVVEVAISRFPGDVGGMLANVNRWRGQVGLAPAEEADLAGMMDRFETPGFVGHTMRLEGAEQHILAASIYETDEDRTWFVRVTTDPAKADAVESDVFAFSRTFGTGN